VGCNEEGMLLLWRPRQARPHVDDAVLGVVEE
jgi:hypothetical protein